MKTIEYIPENVCSRKMIITVDGDIVKSVEIVGGCHGNRQAVARLVEGLTIDQVIEKLEGIECRGSRTGVTSCPDQLAKALKTLKS